MRRTKVGALDIKEPVPEPWTVRHFVRLDDGEVFESERTYSFVPSVDKHTAAGNCLLAERVGERAVIHNDKLYPPHRIQEITWKVL